MSKQIRIKQSNALAILLIYLILMNLKAVIRKQNPPWSIWTSWTDKSSCPDCTSDISFLWCSLPLLQESPNEVILQLKQVLVATHEKWQPRFGLTSSTREKRALRRTAVMPSDCLPAGLTACKWLLSLSQRNGHCPAAIFPVQSGEQHETIVAYWRSGRCDGHCCSGPGVYVHPASGSQGPVSRPAACLQS